MTETSAANEPPSAEPRLIKRYANRKMYDTEGSCYITLEQVARIVAAGQQVRVIDNTTKEDLTEMTLAQALLSSERRKRGSVSLDGLRSLLAHGGELLHAKVADPVARAATEAERTVEKWKTEAERTVGRLVKGIEEPAEEAGTPRDKIEERSEAAAPEEAPKSRQPRIVEQTQRAYDELQQRIDERVRLLVSALTHPSQRDEELARLHARIESLEARVAELEGDPAGAREEVSTDDAGR